METMFNIQISVHHLHNVTLLQTRGYHRVSRCMFGLGRYAGESRKEALLALCQRAAGLC